MQRAEERNAGAEKYLTSKYRPQQVETVARKNRGRHEC